MEDLALNPDFWRGRRVLVTGHTGFKGAWLSFWLAEWGAELVGVALSPTSTPNLFEILGNGRRVRTVFADINDRVSLARLMAEHRPEIVLHLAAQAIVRASYQEPVETFETNVVGVVTLLDVVRQVPGIRAVVVATSDKCYENREWVWGYRESDRLGGHDPYSASKGCAEIAATAMQRSFFAPYASKGHCARIATVRAGNVIGGGDWAEDRLVPDIVRGSLGPGGEVKVRNPGALRPWQHVLEPLRGYLQLAQRLVTAPDGFDQAWNFGPDARDNRTVMEVGKALVAALGVGRIVIDNASDAPHEAHLLRLDCSKANSRLGWTPLLRFEDTIALTSNWYAAWKDGEDMTVFTRSQINDYAPAGRAS